MAPMKISQVILLPLFLQLRQVTGQQLSPPYYNLAQGKPVYASSTCGEDVYEKELFCELTGAHPNAIPDESHFVIRGQVCDYCDPAYPPNSHPASQAVDGTEKWWQSPPLSRGLKYNEVNFTIPFGQVSLLRVMSSTSEQSYRLSSCAISIEIRRCTVL